MTQKKINKRLRTPSQKGIRLWITVIKWSVGLLLSGSILILLICAVRLLFRIANIGSNIDYLSELSFIGGISLGEWCNEYAQREVLRPIFVAMGLIHASFSLIVSVREKRLYGIHLQDAIQEVFPLLGWSYLSYTLLIVLGLYASGMEYSLTALICLVGALFGFVAPWIVTAFLTFGQHSQQAVVEYYLSCHKYPKQNKKSARDKTMVHILACAHYINGYYTTTQTVPVNVVLCAWHGFTVTMTGMDLLESDSKSSEKKLNVTLGNILTTAQVIIGARTFWKYALQGIPDQEQTVFVRQLLSSAVRDYSVPPKSADQFFTAPYRSEVLPADYTTSIIPLSGLISYLREQMVKDPAENAYWSSWNECFQYLYLISSDIPTVKFSYSERNFDDVEKCDFCVRLLFLLMLVVFLGELSMLELDELRDCRDLCAVIDGMSQKLHVSISWVPRFMFWGLSVIFSYSADWFGSTQGILSLYDTYQWLSCILDAADSTGDNREVS